VFTPTDALIRIEQLSAERQVALGQGNARNLAPGYLFDLEKYPRADQNQQYLIESAQYQFEENVYRADGGGGSGISLRAGIDSPTRYRLSIAAVPSTVAYRSQQSTPKPHTNGPQTAVVVGPPSEEIWTDQYGRVKVQFHWDRYGQMDQNSSCWIRVSQAWAGANYGTMHIPRIGQEVIVDFLNGDPDYPIITGRVYNAMLMPPWDLPANKTQSGIKTRSSKNGTPGSGEKKTPGTTNIIRFEDMAGKEQLWFHAQKDQLTEVENDEDKWVGNDRRKTIDHDETSHIKHDRTETVDNNETITIHGNRTETVDKDETITIHQNRTETVDLNETITIHGNRPETVDKDETITIHGNRTETVDLNETITIHGNRTETVDQNEQVTISQNQLHTVVIDRTREVGANESIAIGENQTQSIVGTQTQTIGVSQTETIGGSARFDTSIRIRTP
jgi:type VI secretion system secreted protein VgrG